MHRAVSVFLTFISFTLCSLAQTNGMPQRPTGQFSSQDVVNSLAGTVVTADNKPVKDAHIELRDNNGTTVTSTYSNAAGMFEFSQVRTGSYDIVATSGLEQTQERIEVLRMPPQISLRLPRASAPSDGGPRNSISVAEYKAPEKARRELKKAREASASGKSDEAEKHLQKALEIYPKYADALTLRAILKLDTKDHQSAMADLQQAIDIDSNCAMAYLVMGAALNMESKFDDAIRALQRGEALSPGSWQVYFEMGKALVGKAQYEPALRQLNHAQAMAPEDYAPIHIVKAHAMLALNHYSDAMTELQAYLEKEPNGPNSDQAQKMLAQARAFAAGKQSK
jgi:predicted Zn-dependent protease